MRLVLAGSLAAPLLLLGGCTERLPPPAANADSVLALRAFPMTPANVGPFSAAGDAANSDHGVSVRLGTFTPPKGNGWADYLRLTLIAQLRAAGRFEPSSRLKVEATLLENRSGESFSDGRARLAARFIVSRDGKPVYDKVQQVETGWNSSFFGFVAYETAMRHYTAMYPVLLDKLFADPEFRVAVA
jgi:hypothetical protein